MQSVTGQPSHLQLHVVMAVQEVSGIHISMSTSYPGKHGKVRKDTRS
jgi:hypothetical protein